MIRLGSFELLTSVGRGGMGQVWRGVHHATQTPIAVKILDDKAIRTPGFAEAFRDEARVVAGLMHPHIVSVFELGTLTAEQARASKGALQEKSPYLVMEYAHRGALTDALDSLRWPEMFGVTCALLEALAHAHAHGVIHLDVKPANILLGCGRPDVGLIEGLRLTDFGLSWRERAPGRAERRAELGGTLGRMAPEQIQATWREYGPWTDLYAVGALVWQYATGKKPFAGMSRAAMLTGPLVRADLPFVPIREVPEGLEDWLRALMARNPADRFMLAADALDGFQSMETVSRPRIRLSPPTVSESERQGGWGAGPAMPASWGPGRVMPTPAALVDVGLSLFGLRELPFVGREAERDRLWKMLQTVRDEGRASAVMIRGASGVGKSRLARWLGQRAHSLGIISAVIAVEHARDGADPLAGLRPALARLLGCVELDLTQAEVHLERVLSWWGVTATWMPNAMARWLLPMAEPPAEPPEVLLATLLQGMSRQRPVLLWLDDAQWGLDSLDALRHLMRVQAAAPSSVLTVLTVGDAALEDRREARGVLNEIGPAVIELGPLSPPEDELLIRMMTGLEPTLTRRLAERTAGNPLMAVHIIGDWIARGVLKPDVTGFSLEDDQEALPDEMSDLWSRRLAAVTAGLPERSVEALEMAAVLGVEVRVAEWRALLLGWDPEPLLDRLLRARLARPTDRGWAFVHGALREVLARQAQAAGRWEGLHRSCARLLVAGRTPELKERLGLHLLHSGEPRLAFAHLMNAARVLEHQGHARAASRIITRANEALDQQGISPTDRRRCTCRLLMALIEIRRHHPRHWLAELRHWRDVSHREGWVDLEAEALWILGEACQKSDLLKEAATCMEAAYKLARRLNLPRIQLESQLGLSLLLMRQGEMERAGDRLAKVLAAPPLAEAPGVQEGARLNLASIARSYGRMDDARRYASEAIRRGEAADLLDVIAHGQLILAAVAEQEGQLEQAEQYLRDSLEKVQRTGKFRALSLTWNSLGEIARRQGRDLEAESCYRTSLAWAEASGRPIEAPEMNLAILLDRRGLHEEARDRLESLIGRASSLGDSRTLWRCQVCLLPVYANLGDWPQFDELL
ncbi:MAG: protein kinase, partial [Myxococcota bacterium]